MADHTAHPKTTLDSTLHAEVSLAASQLSALVDHELEEREMDLVLRRLDRDDSARDRWERYHLIGDLLRGQAQTPLDAQFAARIRQAVAAESVPQSAVKPRPTWYKPAAGFALAASVVLVTLFGLQPSQTDGFPPSTPRSATAPVSPARFSATPISPARFAAAPALTLAAFQPGDVGGTARQTRLKQYLMNHNGYASRNSIPSVLPYARLVDYQLR